MTVTAQADTATGQAVIRVRAVPVITWATPVAIPWGTALSTNQLSASTSIPGIFTYAPAVGTVPEVGSQALAVTFVPTDGVTYQTAMATVVQVVTKALSTVT